jgi:hypothetical protein
MTAAVIRAFKMPGSTPSSPAPKINAVRPSRSKKPEQDQCPQGAILRQGKIRAPRHVIEAEVFGDRIWRQVVSSDGVVCEVGTLRPRALQTASRP